MVFDYMFAGQAHKLANNEPNKIHLARRYARTSSCISLIGMVVTFVLVLPIALVIGLSPASKPASAAANDRNTTPTVSVESCSGFIVDSMCYACRYFKGSCITDNCCQSSEVYVDFYCYSSVNCTHSAVISSAGSVSATDVKTRTNLSV